jgi:EpsI family protein
MNRFLRVAVLGVLAAGLLGAFWRPLSSMVAQWSASPMYSHAFTVPLISAGMIYAWRDRFARLTPRPARFAALPFLAIALAMLIGGELAAIVIVQQLAFVLAIAAIVLFLLGYEYLAVGWPAVAYLLFMVPFWDAFTEPMHEPFQHNSARIGIALMQAVGVPAYREGTVIALPNVVIEVARACSGVNYLIAVLALALPLAFLRLKEWWRRIVLVVSALAISALANGVRVALIGVLAYLEIGSPLHGPFHVLHGLFVAAVGYVVIFAGLALLERGSGPSGAAERHPQPAPSSAQFPRVTDACGLAFALWIIVLAGVSPVAAPVALSKPLDTLPMRLGTWTADAAAERRSDPTDAWATADQHLQRRYRASGDAVDVHVWYFQAQNQGREIVNYRVADLHRRAHPQQVALPDGTSMTVNAVAGPSPNTVALFWYELGGSPEAREYAAKFRSVWRVLRSGRSDAAAIMLVAPAQPSDEAKALGGLENLAREVHLGLSGHWGASGNDAPPRPLQ